MRFIITLGLTILLAACGTTTNYYSQTAQSWEGSKLNSLAKTWGRPDDLKNSPSGQKVYVYKSESYIKSNVPTTVTAGVNYNSQGKPVIVTHTIPNVSGNRGGASTCMTFFIADKNGTIIRTQVAGNGCYGDAAFAQRMSNPGKKKVS